MYISIFSFCVCRLSDKQQYISYLNIISLGRKFVRSLLLTCSRTCYQRLSLKNTSINSQFCGLITILQTKTILNLQSTYSLRFSEVVTGHFQVHFATFSFCPIYEWMAFKKTSRIQLFYESDGAFLKFSFVIMESFWSRNNSRNIPLML